jgi:SulP family sulfate permease
LFTLLYRGYSWGTFQSDLLAGLTVATIALPLALALAIASGTTPERGLFTAIVAGFLTSLFGGSRFQIGGPTGAFVIVIFNVIQKFGYEGLVVTTLMAGAILIVAGIAGLGTIIRYVPHPVISGFTAGIGILIMVGQVKDFFGLTCAVPAEFLDKMKVYGEHIGQAVPQAWILALGTLIVTLWIRKKRPTMPAFIITIIGSTAIAVICKLSVETIGSRFGSIPSALPYPSLPSLSLAGMADMLPAALTIAFLAGVESLLSATIADSMTGTRHRPNCELIAQGIANIGSVIFGGIPATGALARTAANIRSGGKTPVAGMLHAVFLLLFMKVLAPLAVWVPLCVLAATLVVVAWNMIELDHVIHVARTSRSDLAVFLITFLLTLVSDVTIAVSFGALVAVLLFTGRMITLAESQYKNKGSFEIEQEADQDDAFNALKVPKRVRVVYLSGPFFFGVASTVNDLLARTDTAPKVIVLELSAVPFIDATGFHTLTTFVKSSYRSGVPVLVAGVTDKRTTRLFTYLFTQVLEKQPIDHYLFDNLDQALVRAQEISASL